MSFRGDGEDERRVARCARCAAIVFAEPAGSCHTDANTICELCGITMLDLPFVDGDYFNVIMKAGRPLGHVARLRRVRKHSAVSL
jgi:hypothetical protein